MQPCYAAAMKVLSAVLAVILVMHLQCGSLCSADSLKPPATEQPCHKHSGAPASSSHQSHDSSSRCGQGSLIEAKSAFVGKQMLTALFAVMPVPPAIVRSGESFLPLFRCQTLQPTDFS